MRTGKPVVQPPNARSKPVFREIYSSFVLSGDSHDLEERLRELLESK